VVRRIFEAVASGEGFYGVERMLESEGVRGPKSVKYPAGALRWSRVTLRNIILNDLYRPHTYEEAKELVSPEAATTLDPEKRYGIWRFGKHRAEKECEGGLDAQIPNGPVAVAVPESGIPRTTVDAARVFIENNRRPSKAGHRFWELSGGIIRCSGCGGVMESSAAKGRKKTKSYFYYRCSARYNRGLEACANSKHYRAEQVEGRAWELVSGYLKNPEKLHAGLQRMIDLEREAFRGDPTQEARGWVHKVSEVERKRSGFQDMAAEGLITFEELWAKLANLEKTRKTAERELEALKNRSERIGQLERGRDELLSEYAGAIPQRLENLNPEDRRQLYKTLKLGLLADPSGNLEATGVFVVGLGVSEKESTSSPCDTMSRSRY